jgi:hypothetical protein
MRKRPDLSVEPSELAFHWNAKIQSMYLKSEIALNAEADLLSALAGDRPTEASINLSSR